MSSDEISRFFDLLQAQGKTLIEQGNLLAAIAQSQKDTHARLFGEYGQPGTVTYLDATVKKHTDQIAFWRGSLAVITFIFTSAMAWAGIILSKHR